MSSPLDQQQQQQEPPPMEGTQQAAYTTHTGYGSVGPVIAVLAVITILGVIAGMIGRVCSSRRILGHGQYDIEGWVERKCSSCLDGHVAPPPTRPADIPVAAPVVKEGPQETREEKQEQIQHKPLAENYVQLPEILLSHHRSSGYVGRRNPILEEEAISHDEHHHESGTRKDLKYRTDGS